MFTGIVEEVGEVVDAKPAGSSLELVVRARMAPELHEDQSVAHNGVCLTVTQVIGDRYHVTMVEETLRRSTLAGLKPGDRLNLERSLRLGDRLDGHLVQGHVDATVACLAVEDREGSRWFTFGLPDEKEMLVGKGSVCLDGVSLTIAALEVDRFSVAVIPYTLAHTTFRGLRPGMHVNVEFDVIGKYVARLQGARVNA